MFCSRRVQTRARHAMEGDSKGKLYLDFEILDCPICTEPLSRPIFQCENGHPICSSCSGQASIIRQGCPSCFQPTGRIRNLAVEKILDSLQIPCKHGPHGCAERLPYNNSEKRKEHEEHSCPFQPFPCPFSSCSHEGPLAVFSSHLTEAHSVNRRVCKSRKGEKFRMSCEQNGVLLERPREGEDDADAVTGLVLVHRERGDSLGDSFFCSAYGDQMACALMVKRADSEMAYGFSRILHDFSRTREREQLAGAVGARLLVPVPRVTRQTQHKKLFGVGAYILSGEDAEDFRAELEKLTGDSIQCDSDD